MVMSSVTPSKIVGPLDQIVPGRHAALRVLEADHRLAACGNSVSLTMAGALVALYAVGGMMYTFVAGAVLRRLGERGLALAGGVVLCLAFLVYLLGPAWGWAVLASALAGFGYYLLHATLQTNATQMVPDARGTAVAWFASCLFMGQAAGVALAGVMVDAVGAQAP
jgi:MFS family permease